MEFIKPTYEELIDSKVLLTENTGFKAEFISDMLKGHQVDCATWLCDGGRRALFSSFGTGKTVIGEQCALSCLQMFPDAKVLIICPKAVIREFKKDDAKLMQLKERYGIELEHIKTHADQLASTSRLHITNYERVREGDIDVNIYIMVILDEASVLRSSGSKTYIQFLQKFRNIKFRIVQTATPAPNDYIELLNYAAFLGIMDVSQAKTMFFKRNSEQADDLELLPNMQEEFWHWVHSWALFLPKPSFLGYSDEGYDLPELKVVWHLVKSDVDLSNKDEDKKGKQLQMLAKPARGLSPEAKVKRLSVDERLTKAVEIIDDAHWIIWHHQEREREAIEHAFKLQDCKAVFGKQPDEIKESLLAGFADGEFKILATKPEIAGSGCNFQGHCHKALFLGINHKFNDFLQAIHRIYRFGQEHPVEIHIVYTEQEEHIRKDLLVKWKQHDELIENQRELIEKHGLSNRDSVLALKRSKSIVRQESKGVNFHIVNNDNYSEIINRPDNSDDMQLSSWPFSIQYEYSSSYFDYGHNLTNQAFFNQIDFLAPETLRTLKPGRISAIHVKDRVVPGNFSGKGMYTTYRFSDDVADCMEKHGFEFMGRITVVCDVVRENNQTYRLSYGKMLRDGTIMGCGSNEYIMLFRKPQTDKSKSFADLPVTNTEAEYPLSHWQVDAHGLYRSSGNRLLTPSEMASHDLKYAMRLFKQESLTEVYNYQRHLDIAEAFSQASIMPKDFMCLPPQSSSDFVWADVTRMRGLNTTQGQRQEDQHICPLPFDIPNRLIKRYTNKGEVVADYFNGIGTTAYCALKLDRKAFGVELNPDYYNIGRGYCLEVEYKNSVPTLFDMLNINEKEVAA